MTAVELKADPPKKEPESGGVNVCGNTRPVGEAYNLLEILGPGRNPD